MSEEVKRAKELFKGMTMREIILYNALETRQLREHVETQNGRIGKLEIKTWLLIAVVAAILGEGILKVFAF